jgi:AraC-like DNA-binding protein
VPPVAPRFRSDSVDEVRAYIAQGDTDHSRQVLGTGPLGFEHVVLPGRLLQLHWVTQRLGQIARGGYTVDSMVHVPVSDALQYKFGRRRLDVAVGQAVFLVPGQHYDVQTPPGTSFALGLSLTSLEREIKPYLRSADGVWLPRTCRLSLAGAMADTLLGQIADLIRILTSAEEVPAATLEQSEVDVLTSLARLLAESGGAAHASQLSAERALLVEEWIDAHLHEPITLGRLREVTGVGSRCLQKTFLSRRGSTPIQYVINRRLEAARTQLLGAVGALDVTSIAMACGFNHMGRFSTMYRQRFGESPSTTLRRRIASVSVVRLPDGASRSGAPSPASQSGDQATAGPVPER